MTQASAVGLRRFTGEILSQGESSAADGAWQNGMLRDMATGTKSRFVAVGLRFMPVGAVVDLEGVLEIHPEYGEQIRVRKVASVSLPRTDKGVALWIAGNVHGIGPAYARRIVRALGTDAIDRLAEDPNLLERIFPGQRGRKFMQSWRAWLHEWEASEAAMDIATRLMSVGVTRKTAHKIITYFGAAEVAEIALGRRPYRLLSVPGFGWRRADAIAGKLGFRDDNPDRLAAGVQYTLNQATLEGHSCLPREDLIRSAADGVLNTVRAARAGIPLATQRGVVVEEAGRFYLPHVLEAEWTVASRLIRHARLPAALPPKVNAKITEVASTSRLSSEQQKAVRSALNTGVFVLTGGPGTGKTTTVRAIVEAARRAGLSRIRIAAPTGKAAARASTVTGVEAETIHRMIGGPPGEIRREGHLQLDLVIIDETSMVSLEMCAWLLINLSPGTRIIFVGDEDQLPSVDHGALLRDLLASGAVASARLRQVYRQESESAITANAYRILAGKTLVHGTGFEHIAVPSTDRRESAESVRRELVATLQRLQHEGWDVVNDVQVLSPMRRGRLGVDSLNHLLQETLNPAGQNGPEIGGGRIARVGDRVVQFRNDYSLGERGVFNGEQGIVKAVGAERAVVAWDGDRELEVTGYRRYNLRLGWASTIHRSQGSEWPVVVTLYDSSHGRMLAPQLLYTAVTRAREYFIMIGDAGAYDLSRKRVGQREDGRFTGLAGYLAETAA